MASDGPQKIDSKPNQCDFSVNQNISCECWALMNEFAGETVSFRTKTLYLKNTCSVFTNLHVKI